MEELVPDIGSTQYCAEVIVMLFMCYNSASKYKALKELSPFEANATGQFAAIPEQVAKIRAMYRLLNPEEIDDTVDAPAYVSTINPEAAVVVTVGIERISCFREIPMLAAVELVE